jgi:hypothetical protein
MSDDWQRIRSGRSAKSSGFARLTDATIATMELIRMFGTRRNRLSHSDRRWEPSANGLPPRADFSRQSMFLSNSCS